MCSRMAAKLMNSSDESSIGSAVYFSNSVFTENLDVGPERQTSILISVVSKGINRNKWLIINGYMMFFVKNIRYKYKYKITLNEETYPAKNNVH